MAVRYVPYTDARGNRQWVAVAADVAAELERYDRWARRREALWRARHRTATDVDAAREQRPRKDRHARSIKLIGYLNYELEPASRATYLSPDDSNPWEGPRATFTHLIGEGPTWDGPKAHVRVSVVVHYATGNMVETSEYGVEAVSPAECPRCRGVRLERHEVCLVCCRTKGD